MESIAKLDLQPRKVFTLTLVSGKQITGQFGTYALKRFCDKSGIPLKDAQSRLTDLSGFADYLLCAVEYICRKEKQPFSYTDVDVCEWIDEMGGVSGDLFYKLIEHTADENVEEEKKTPATILAGES